MNYIIKPYNEKYLEDQVRITFDVTNKWKYQPQLSLDGLKNTYSADGFDPTTRLYAFINDEMIGCISASKSIKLDGRVYGSTRTPFVVDGHEPARQLLMDQAIDALKNSGVEVLQASSCEGLGYSMDLLTTNGFRKSEESFILGKEQLKDLKIGNTNEGVEVYDPDKHKTDLLKILHLWFPNNTETTFNFYKNARIRKSDEKVSWQVYYEDGELVGFGILMRSDRDIHQYRGPLLYVDTSVSNRLMVAEKLYAAHAEKFEMSGNELVQVFLPVSRRGQEAELYISLGFVLDTFYIYEKEL